MIKSKKGLSAIVASLLLILITISAVTIVANFIIPFTKDSLESTDCFKFKDYFNFEEEFGFNCLNKADNTYVLTVGTRPNDKDSEKVKGFKLRFMSDGVINTIGVNDQDAPTEISMMDNSISPNLIIPVAGGRYTALTYNYSSTVEYEKVGIYAVLSNDQICEESDSIKITEC